MKGLLGCVVNADSFQVVNPTYNYPVEAEGAQASVALYLLRPLI